MTSIPYTAPHGLLYIAGLDFLGIAVNVFLIGAAFLCIPRLRESLAGLYAPIQRFLRGQRERQSNG